MKDTNATTSIKKRAVLIGVLLIIANSYWIAYVEMIWHTAHLTTVSLSVNVMFAVLMITWLNIIVRQVSPKAALNQQDLLVIYAMLAVGSCFSGHDAMPRLMGLMPYAFRFATPENDWAALLFHHLPDWLIISDPKTVTRFLRRECRFLWGRLPAVLDNAYPIVVNCYLFIDAHFPLPDIAHQKAVGRPREIGVSDYPNPPRNHS